MIVSVHVYLYLGLVFKGFNLSFSLLQSWDVFFRNANTGVPPGAAYVSPPSLSGPSQGLPTAKGLVGAQPNIEKLVSDHLAVQTLIRAYQVNYKPELIAGMSNYL